MGYCWPCVSLNGGVYFAASTHISIGLFMTGYLTYFCLHSLLNGLQSDYSFFVIFLLYALTLLTLGCFIFSGVEKKSVDILKPAAIAFGVLHSLIFLRVIYVILSKIILALTSDLTYRGTSTATATVNYSKGDLSSDTFGILFFTFLFFATVIYLALLAMHIKDLQNLQKQGSLFSQVQLGFSNGDGNPLYTYDPV